MFGKEESSCGVGIQCALPNDDIGWVLKKFRKKKVCLHGLKQNGFREGGNWNGYGLDGVDVEFRSLGLRRGCGTEASDAGVDASDVGVFAGCILVANECEACGENA